MFFSNLVRELPGARTLGRPDVNVESIVYDSRRATAGSLFVAVGGETFDGHQFAGAAVKNGAVAIIAERELPGIPLDDVSVAVVDDSRVAMAAVAAKFYDYPSRNLKLIGVTGTKGKTTTTYLIASIFRSAGWKTGVIGTIGSRVGDEVIDSEHTTPESVDLQALLARMAASQAQLVAMEVSSHGLAQGRVAGCEFDCGIFTNLTRDHLDYHSTMEEYLDAKLLLFKDCAAASGKEFTAVVNLDDPVSSKVVAAANGRVITFGVKAPADVTASDIRATAKGVSYLLTYRGERVEVGLRLGGLFNVYNSLAAAGAALSQGLGLSRIAAGLASAENVAGRFESIECGQDFAVLVDYAHAPDALENVLIAARDLTDGRLIVVFGCGGNRDRGKRPMMGRIASELADMCVVTSDNPRKEDPDAIIGEILAGVDGGRRGRVSVEASRRDAIRMALDMAGSGDVVLVAGKGHEDYQIFADKTIHFDDREVVREILCSKALS
ncbi:MAG: UDP-N-acetylmuramoyl-L-alanyl-D-glutamate--2,6-diaminopimelate ligase [Armatimonadota bacterium]|nr:UDP-N-acetylmuramoyl-L-alanyl-D-glutamate--2,6-diaminopimelate ligase [Armatimonadota bacterium]